jgi:hypothetical protein
MALTNSSAVHAYWALKKVSQNDWASIDLRAKQIALTWSLFTTYLKSTVSKS